jgi:hypothetical protein
MEVSMKFNRFTEKGLRNEFKFINELLDGQEQLHHCICESCSYEFYAGKGDIRRCPLCNGWTKDKLVKEEIEAIRPEEVLIKRIDKDLLNSTPSQYFWDGSVVSIARGQRVHFVLSDRIIRNAVKTDYESGSNYAHSETIYGEGETILHAIDRHGLGALCYIVIEEFGIHEENHSSYGNRLIVYKPAKGDLIKVLIEQAYKEANAQVVAESDF